MKYTISHYGITFRLGGEAVVRVEEGRGRVGSTEFILWRDEETRLMYIIWDHDGVVTECGAADLPNGDRGTPMQFWRSLLPRVTHEAFVANPMSGFIDVPTEFYEATLAPTMKAAQ